LQITALSLPIYTTLKFTHVIEYDRRTHKDTQTELYEQEMIHWNQIQNVVHSTNSQGKLPS